MQGVKILLGLGQRLLLHQDLVRNLPPPDVVEQRTHAEGLHRLLRQLDVARHHQREHGDVERMEIQLLAADLVAHHVDRQIGRGENRIGDLFDQFARLAHRLFGIAEQVLLDPLDRPRGIDEDVLDPGRGFALFADLLDQHPFGRQRRMLARHIGQFGRGRGRLFFRLGRAPVAARRVVAHLLDTEAADHGDLLGILDLEMVEGERMLEPLQVEMHVHPHLQFVHRYENYVLTLHPLPRRLKERASYHCAPTWTPSRCGRWPVGRAARWADRGAAGSRAARSRPAASA